MFKSQSKQTLAQQLKNKFSFSTPHGKDGAKPRGSPNERRLPRVPSEEEEKIMKLSLKEKATPAHNEYLKSYGAFFLEYSIAAEFNHLKKTRLPGLYVIPSASDPLVWFGVVFIRQGIYQDGVFRFTMYIPANYPDGDCPKVTFNPPVYHPIVDLVSGDLDLTSTFSPWKPNVNHLCQVLLYIRRMFYKFDSTKPSNVQAAELFNEDLLAYKEKVKNEISEINNKLYEKQNNSDPHSLNFKRWQPEVHEEIRTKLFASKAEKEEIEEDDFQKPKLSGLSFVEPGTTLIFSKEN